MADYPFRADFKSSSFLAEQYLSSITRSTFSASNANRLRTLLMTRVGLKQIPRQMKISMCGSLKTGNLESYSKKQLLSILHVCSQIKRMHTTQQLVCYEGLLHKWSASYLKGYQRQVLTGICFLPKMGSLDTAGVDFRVILGQGGLAKCVTFLRTTNIKIVIGCQDRLGLSGTREVHPVLLTWFGIRQLLIRTLM